MAYRPAARSGLPTCDSFFVESHNDVCASQTEQRERARALARERQVGIAEQLSRLTCQEYQGDVLRHMEHMEADTLPDVASIDIQSEIQWFMRPYLLDFLVEAHAAFQLLPETLFLAVNLLDRYCSKRVVYKRHYQLVGCASLLIAAKYGDRKERVPTIRELKSMCCALYDDDMFTQMEWHVLQTLDWLVGHPTVDAFLKVAMSEASYDRELEHLSWYLCEIAMFHKDFVSTRPSVMARSALALARCILGRSQPAPTEWAAQYDSFTMVGLSQHLHRPSQVLSKKYASSDYSSVAVTMETFLARQASIARSYAPPTPPSDATVAPEGKPFPGEPAPHTPVKGPLSNVVHGVLTPPITPDHEYFGGGAHAKHIGVGATPMPMPITPSIQDFPQHSFDSDLEPYHAA